MVSALKGVVCTEKIWEIRPYPKAKQISNLIRDFASGNFGCLELVSSILSQLLNDKI